MGSSIQLRAKTRNSAIGRETIERDGGRRRGVPSRVFTGSQRHHNSEKIHRAVDKRWVRFLSGTSREDVRNSKEEKDARSCSRCPGRNASDPDAFVQRPEPPREDDPCFPSSSIDRERDARDAWTSRTRNETDPPSFRSVVGCSFVRGIHPSSPSIPTIHPPSFRPWSIDRPPSLPPKGSEWDGNALPPRQT